MEKEVLVKEDFYVGQGCFSLSRINSMFLCPRLKSTQVFDHTTTILGREVLMQNRIRTRHVDEDSLSEGP